MLGMNHSVYTVYSIFFFVQKRGAWQETSLLIISFKKRALRTLNQYKYVIITYDFDASGVLYIDNNFKGPHTYYKKNI